MSALTIIDLMPFPFRLCAIVLLQGKPTLYITHTYLVSTKLNICVNTSLTYPMSRNIMPKYWEQAHCSNIATFCLDFIILNFVVKISLSTSSILLTYLWPVF